ncbi:hypothetical protein [Corynebacterium uterequi]|uniref:Uncharacterized protein n=1 Tax=Corynebacterium uterequi TaxID=1072256 RepID=A0A0G3HAB2_9CORY|nr:hypothetical protein [Corynebacterium uterequi]AKK10254.1 hypothetical protein CUTER_01170 [Corynebacterium uterequi]
MTSDHTLPTPLELDQQWFEARSDFHRGAIDLATFGSRIAQLRAKLAPVAEGDARAVKELDYRFRLSAVVPLLSEDPAEALDELLALLELHRSAPRSYPAHEDAVPGSGELVDGDGIPLPNRFDDMMTGLGAVVAADPTVSLTRVMAVAEAEASYCRERDIDAATVAKNRAQMFFALGRFDEADQELHSLAKLGLVDGGGIEFNRPWLMELQQRFDVALARNDLDSVRELLEAADTTPLATPLHPALMWATAAIVLAEEDGPDATMQRARRVLSSAGHDQGAEAFLTALPTAFAAGWGTQALEVLVEAEALIASPREVLWPLTACFQAAERAGLGDCRIPRFDAPRWAAQVGRPCRSVAEAAAAFYETVRSEADAADARNHNTAISGLLAKRLRPLPFAPAAETLLGTVVEAISARTFPTQPGEDQLSRLPEEHVPSPWTYRGFYERAGHHSAVNALEKQLGEPDGEALRRFCEAVEGGDDESSDRDFMAVGQLLDLYDDLSAGSVDLGGEIEAPELRSMIEVELAWRAGALDSLRAAEIAARGLPTILQLDPSFCVNRGTALYLIILRLLKDDPGERSATTDLRRSLLTLLSSVAVNELANPNMCSELFVLCEALMKESALLETVGLIEHTKEKVALLHLRKDKYDERGDENLAHLFVMKAEVLREAGNYLWAAVEYFQLGEQMEQHFERLTSGEPVDDLDALSALTSALAENWAEILRTFVAWGNLGSFGEELDAILKRVKEVHEKGLYKDIKPRVRAKLADACLRVAVRFSDAYADAIPERVADYLEAAQGYVDADPDPDVLLATVRTAAEVVDVLLGANRIEQAQRVATWAASHSPASREPEVHVTALVMLARVHYAEGEAQRAGFVLETAAEKAQAYGLTGCLKSIVEELRRVGRDDERAAQLLRTLQ